MPNFNFGTAYNTSGQTMQSPEEQLLELILRALAYGGYQAVSPAALRRAGADEALLAPLRTREKLCRWALEEMVERIRMAYKLVTEQARTYLEGTEKSEDEGVKQLERLLYRHIHLCLHPKNRIYVLAAANEAQLPQPLGEMLPKALQSAFCDVLEELILSVAQVKKQKEAAMLAASVCACVQFYAVQPELAKRMFIAKTRHEPNYAEVEDMLNNMLLRSIVANTAINKPF